MVYYLRTHLYADDLLGPMIALASLTRKGCGNDSRVYMICKNLFRTIRISGFHTRVCDTHDTEHQESNGKNANSYASDFGRTPEHQI